MNRRVTQAFLMTVTLVALLGVLIVPSAPPAQAVAGGSCSIVVSPTVWVDSPYELIPATLDSDCAASGVSYASWGVRHSYYGPSGIFIFDEASSDTDSFYDWEHFGTYFVEPGNSWDANLNDLTQNTTSYVVKSGSGVAVKAARVGSYVTMTASAMYYSPSAEAYIPWRGAKVALQYRTCNTCTWKYLRSVSTAATGKASYRFYAPRTRYYRGVLAATSSVWGRTSATTAR